MADNSTHQGLNQDQLESQVWALKGTTMSDDASTASYTPVVHNVLSHNRGLAEQTDTKSIPTSTPVSSLDVDPVFAILQRPIDISLEWANRSWLAGISSDPVAVKIRPLTHLPFPQTTVGAPTLAYWHLNFGTKKRAVLTRFGRTSMEQPVKESIRVRDLATFDWPESTEGGDQGPSVSFEPHEDEITRSGASQVKKTESRMVLTKDFFGAPRYMIGLPASLGQLNVMWVLGHVHGYADGRLLADPSREAEVALEERLSNENQRPVATDSSSEMPSKKDPWTPYPTQYLIDSNTGRVLATYTRWGPFTASGSRLTIFPKILTAHPEQYEQMSAELIEAIVVVTAAMVLVQQRTGLISGLFEAGAESMRWLEQAPHPTHSDP